MALKDQSMSAKPPQQEGSRRLQSPRAPVPGGELMDKTTILETKAGRLSAAGALENVRRELALLTSLMQELEAPPRLSQLKSELRLANSRLWDIENAIRDKEARKEFD